jgi:hypothetical protein
MKVPENGGRCASLSTVRRTSLDSRVQSTRAWSGPWTLSPLSFGRLTAGKGHCLGGELTIGVGLIIRKDYEWRFQHRYGRSSSSR